MNHSGNTKGRQPKPTPLQTSEIDHINAPTWFTPYAVLAFDQLKPLVVDRAKAEDLPLFYSMCVAFGKVMESEEAIKEHGLTVVNEKGVICKNPLWSVQKEATQVFNALCVKFALSPVDRARNANEQAQQAANDPMAHLLLKAQDKRV